MKKLYLLIPLILISLLSKAQNSLYPSPPQKTGVISQSSDYQNGMFLNGVLQVKIFYDTTAANAANYFRRYPFSEIATSSDGKRWFRNITTSQWISYATGTTPSSAWLTTGNTSIDTSVNFIGTIDNKDWVIKRGNVRSGWINSDRGNTSFGYNSLPNNSTGGQANTGIGAFSLPVNTSGGDNTSVGYSALNLNNIGSQNTAVGGSALGSNTDGNYNTAVGAGSMGLTTHSYKSTALGYNAGRALDGDTFNISLGFDAHPLEQRQLYISDSTNSFKFGGLSKGGTTINYVLTDTTGDGDLSLQPSSGGGSVFAKYGLTKNTDTIGLGGEIFDTSINIKSHDIYDSVWLNFGRGVIGNYTYNPKLPIPDSFAYQTISTQNNSTRDRKIIFGSRGKSNGTFTIKNGEFDMRTTSNISGKLAQFFQSADTIFLGADSAIIGIKNTVNGSFIFEVNTIDSTVRISTIVPNADSSTQVAPTWWVKDRIQDAIFANQYILTYDEINNALGHYTADSLGVIDSLQSNRDWALATFLTSVSGAIVDSVTNGIAYLKVHTDGATITGDGSAGSPLSSPACSAWSLYGNLGTDTSINYIGTADSINLLIKTKGTTAIRIDTLQNTRLYGDLYLLKTLVDFTGGSYKVLVQDNSTKKTGYATVATGGGTVTSVTASVPLSITGTPTIAPNVIVDTTTINGLSTVYQNSLRIFNPAKEGDSLFQRITDSTISLGDSFRQPFLSNVSDIQRVADSFNIVIKNLAIGAMGVRKMYQQLMLNMPIVSNAPLTAQIGLNNITTTNTVARDSGVCAGHRAMAALQFAKTFYYPFIGASSAPGFTYSASTTGAQAATEAILLDWSSRTLWARRNDSKNSGANYFNKTSITTNETATLSGVQGKAFAIGTWGVTLNRSRMNITIDGSLVYTYNPVGKYYSGYSSSVEGFTTDTIVNDAIILTGFKDTLHTIVLTFLDGGIPGGFDYVASLKTPEQASFTPFFVNDIPHLGGGVSTGYNTPGYIRTQAVLDTATALRRRNLQAVLPNYPIAFVYTNKYYIPGPLTVNADSVHPTDAGQIQISRASYERMNTGLYKRNEVAPYSMGSGSASITGLTINVLPVATSPTTIGNSLLSQQPVSGSLLINNNYAGPVAHKLLNPNTSSSAYTGVQIGVDSTSNNFNLFYYPTGFATSGVVAPNMGLFFTGGGATNGLRLATGVNAPISFYINNTASMSLNSFGLAIGRTTTSAKLDVNGASLFAGNMTNSFDAGAGVGNASQFMLINSNSTSYKTGINMGGVNTNEKFSLVIDYLAAKTLNFAIYNGLTATNSFFIDATNKIGIGVNTPTSNLHISAGTTGQSQLRLQGSIAPTSPNNGDIWYDSVTTRISARIAGVTKRLDNESSPIVVAGTDLTAQSAATNIVTYTTGAADSTFEVSARLNITAITAGTLQAQVTYFDENNVSRTVAFFSMGSTTAGISAIGYNNYAVLGELRVKASTTITVSTFATVALVGATYNAGATIKKVR